jgi:hypothetical protein
MERGHGRIHRGRLGVIDGCEGQDLFRLVPVQEQVGNLGALVLPMVIGQVLGHQLVRGLPFLDLLPGRGLGHPVVLAAREGAVAHAVRMGRARLVRAVAEHVPLGDTAGHVDRVGRRRERCRQVVRQVLDGEPLSRRLDGLAATQAGNAYIGHRESPPG